MKEVYMFPGQGSQRRGMGKTLFPMFPELCQIAEDTLGYSIEELCLKDPNKQLNRTDFTQPALFFVSCLEFLRLKAEGQPQPDFVLGHSLGLYPALFAAEVFDLKTGLEIVALRGKLMEAASDGKMLAVIGEGVDKLPQYLVQFDATNIDIANLNTPTQAVLSGKAESIEQIKIVLEAMDFRCVMLSVSGPFHSRYMESARTEFSRFLMDIELSKPTIPVVSTTTGEILNEHFLFEEMSFQLTKPVRWLQTISNLATKYPGIQFREVGPNKILQRLNSSIIQQPEANRAQLAAH